LSVAEHIHVLVAPLNWGLGHATRCIPLVRQLRERGYRISLAASGRPAALLRKEFPNLPMIDLPDYGITHPRGGSLVMSLLIKWPGLLLKVRKEHRRLQEIIDQKKIDVVISDNRYGLWSPKIPSVIITHQMMLKLPSWLQLAEKMVHTNLQRRLRHFNEIWIPDQQKAPGLAGDLAHKYPLPEHTRFIGWMSRFADFKEAAMVDENAPAYDVVALLSGPEPQRSLFQEILERQMQKSGLQCCMILGKPGEESSNGTRGNITFLAHAEDKEMHSILSCAAAIICRPGYSTLMDLVCLKRPAILIPTPGQTEQEYLARCLSERKLFVICPQGSFNLSEALDKCRGAIGFAETPTAGAFFELPDLNSIARS
jgi:predicted glycosyltransferase